MWLSDLPHSMASRLRRRAIRPVVGRVNALEAEVSKRSDADLRQAAARLRQRQSHGESLDELLPEAYALVREAARRTVRQRHYDVQVLGATAIHRGWVAEMQTGEGKTLVATMPAFLNALPGRGVHVVTTNDYLAQRDADWMGAIYRALGLTVSCIVHGMTDPERVKAYQADITYGTNKEFAFDYLRDQLRAEDARRKRTGGVLEQSGSGRSVRAARVQRAHHFAIVDEVDSILIDESRVPLIIAESQGTESLYARAYAAAREAALALEAGRDYTMDMPRRSVELTTAGIERLRRVAAPPLPPARPFEHLVRQALQAEHMFVRDRDYLVVDGKVSIVDEFTGRMMADRSWSLGLHQSVETKEAVSVTDENRTLASVTFQRYFRLYAKLAGMTGTARESRGELGKVFDLPVLSIPTNKPLRRRRLPYRVYATWEQKYAAIVARILELNAESRPVLVGTRSVYRSEVLSAMLTERGVEHRVLNAHHHAEEAAIIAEAGQPGRVTIATNMAGRGVDIMLGTGVENLGGLHVLGTELHEAGRIDRQLGGRSGRQGDPGSFEFFVCTEDELLSRWSKPIAAWLLRRTRSHEGGPLSPLWIHVFELAQRAIERRHLRIRLDLLEHDKKLEEMKGTLGVPVWG